MTAVDLTAALHRLASADTSDGELLGRYVREQDERAFAVLVARHGRMVRAVCRRVLRHDADADDATQATFLVLARKAASVRDRHGLANWLFGVARNVAARAKQARARRAAHEAKVPPRPPQQVASDFAELLDAELAKLPAAYRVAVVLCDLEGHTIADAAKHLGIPPGTVASRLARGRERLADRLRKLGLGVSAGLLATLLGDSAKATVVTFTPTAAVTAAVHTLAEDVMRTMIVTPRLPTLLVAAAALALAAVAWGQAPPPKAAPPAAPKPVAEKGPSPIDVLLQAKKAADEIENVGTRRDSLQSIASEFAEHGDKKRAKEMFEASIQLVQDGGKSRQLSWIIFDMERVGVELPVEFADVLQKEAAFFTAGWYREMGDLKRLAKLAEDATGDDRDLFLAALAVGQAAQGKRAEAEKSIGAMAEQAASLVVDVARLEALAALAVAHHKAKDAKAAAKSIKEAIEVTARIVNGAVLRGGPAAVLVLAGAQAKVGDLTAARDTADRIKDDTLKDCALADIAWAEFEAGKRKEAVNTLETIRTEYHADRVRAKIARHDANNGEWKQAEATIKAMNCVYWQVRAQLDLALRYAAVGKTAEADKALATADELAGLGRENVQDEEPGIINIRRHATILRFRTLAEMGRAKAAVEEAERIEKLDERVDALLAVVRGLRPRAKNEEE